MTAGASGDDDLTLGAGAPLDATRPPSTPQRPAESRPPPPIGAAPVIPEVTLTGVLGKGGMGVVYAGRQEWLARDVAVKVLATHLVDAQFTSRFQREAKLLAGFTHPHVVTCYSAGSTESGVCYLVMERIGGPSLAQHLREKGPLAPREALAVCRDLAGALDHAHQAQVIHRDVKPENVLLAPKKGAAAGDPFPYDVKLADLGLARSTSDGRSQVELTAPGAVLGTPSTMAPEQFEDPDSVDFRADIYGLGCILFHCLTGRQAFPPQPTLASTFSAKLAPKPPDPRLLDEQLDPAIARFVMQLLAKSPEERPASYAAIIATCEQLLARGAAPAGGGKRGLLVAAALGVVAVAGAAFFLLRERPAAPEDGGAVAPVAGAEGSAGEASRGPAKEAPSEAPVAAVAPRLALSMFAGEREIDAASALVEGTRVLLRAALEPAAAELPRFTFAAGSPSGWPVVVDDAAPQRASVVLPRGLLAESFPITLDAPDRHDVEALERLLAIAPDPQLASLARELAVAPVDLLRREPPKNFDDGSDDPARHRLCGGRGGDFASWLLPRGDWRLATRLHLLQLRPDATTGGLRLEFDDGLAVEVVATRRQQEGGAPAEWSVVVGGCRGRTAADAIELPHAGERHLADFTLAPNRAHEDDALAADGVTESQDVLDCTVEWRAASGELAVAVGRVAALHRRDVGWREEEAPAARFTRTLSRADSLGVVNGLPLAPWRAVLWKSGGGLCVHALSLAR
ncbi:MAG: serine/threonine protein kinase [Planctomycetes bacterium]|nr:serine/threonine protein kinase [Planctomycetota bacterium]